MELSKAAHGAKKHPLEPSTTPIPKLPRQVVVPKTSYQAGSNQKPGLDLLEKKATSQNEALVLLHPELLEVFTPVSAKTYKFETDPGKAIAGAKERFAEEFGAKAHNKEEFHQFMKQVFGAGYDKAKAEEFRQRALNGDYSWLPPIELVSADTLQGGCGAYDAKKGVVYMNEDLVSDPELFAQTYIEEAGHHLDTQLNKTDTRGDEGEMFRRVLSGEKLSAAQIQEIRNDNDHGVIEVNGKQVQVEFRIGDRFKKFWKKVGSAIKKACQKIGQGIKKAFTHIGQNIANVAKKFGQGVKDFFTHPIRTIKSAFVNLGKSFVSGAKYLFSGLFNGLKTSILGFGKGVGGFFKNLFQGKIKAAFGSLVQGLDRLFIQGPTKILQGALNSIAENVQGLSGLLGPLAPLAKEFFARTTDMGRTFVNGFWGAATSMTRNLVEGTGTFLGGFGKIFTGDFKGGFKDMGIGLLKTFVETPINTVVFVGGSSVSILQTAIGLEPPATHLTEQEIEALRAVYGDSIDYNQVVVKRGFAGLFNTNFSDKPSRPFTFGNTIYLKGDNTFETLVHEMGHVWQFQNGGTDYMSESVMAQGKNKDEAYDFARSVPGTPWSGLGPEQQSQLIEEAYKYGYFDPQSKNFGKFFYDTNGDGVKEDLTAYFKKALEEMQAGYGMP